MPPAAHVANAAADALVAPEAAAGADDPACALVAREHPCEAQRCGRRRRIIVADDNADAAFCLAVLLRLSDHEVWEVHDGAEAAAVAAHVAPDVVIADAGLPRLDGLARSRDRAGPGATAPLLVAVGARHGTDDPQQLRRAGFDAVMARPLDIPAIFRLLQSADAARPH